ncbi:MAG: pyridoxal phosphate-dependent aminotransferase [Bacteroidales bacterium]|nr:pyridoxal phosphate-dependent aminotransferase [Bacteroidales bacterium]
MKETPINFNIVKEKIDNSGLKPDISSSTIREIVKVVNEIEQATGEKFVRMEMGVPGLPTPKILLNAQIEALENVVTSKYPMIEGDAELKQEASRFVKLFLNKDVEAKCCVPAVGSMQSAMALFLTVNRTYTQRNKILFIDPGFPVQKQQCQVLGVQYETFDVYNFRGEKLRNKIESYLKTDEFSSIIYSNPNNPSWISFTERELKIIGELATKYQAVVIEDLAYFGMDFREDYSQPGLPPYQPSVANYTNNYVIMLSSSKVFSYAGERLGIIIVSPSLFDKSFEGLRRNFKKDTFGYALIYGSLYTLSAGVSHSVQKGMAKMLRAVNNGEYNFIEAVKPYAERANVMKRLFLENGFKIVYEKDEDQDISDGFYFTFSYPGMTGDELLEEMLYYGISAISLKITGSERTEGMRACVSQVLPEQFEILEYRLKKFRENH